MISIYSGIFQHHFRLKQKERAQTIIIARQILFTRSPKQLYNLENLQYNKTVGYMKQAGETLAGAPLRERKTPLREL